MRFDKLRLVAWTFLVVGACGAFEMVESASHGHFYFDFAILGLWIGFDLLELQPRARVWAMRLAGLQTVILALFLAAVLLNHLTSGWFAAPSFSAPWQVALGIVSLAASGWQFHVLRQSDIRACFAHEQDRDASETGPGVRLFAATILAAAFAVFADTMSWHLRGNVTGISQDALPHTVVVARDVQGRTWQSHLTDSSTYNFQFWRRPSGPVKVAVCDTRSRTPSHQQSFGYQLSGGRLPVTAEAGDADRLCAP